jgi:hypothetical protein
MSDNNSRSSEAVEAALNNLELKDTYKQFCVQLIAKRREAHAAAVAVAEPNAAVITEAYNRTEAAVALHEAARGRVRYALCTLRHSVAPGAPLPPFNKFPMERAQCVAVIRRSIVDGRREEEAVGVVRPPCCRGTAADCCTRSHAGGGVCVDGGVCLESISDSFFLTL